MLRQMHLVRNLMGSSHRALCEGDKVNAPIVADALIVNTCNCFKVNTSWHKLT